ncbi:Cytochrome P450 [Macrophomina phaseolina MS6]|uniref:Cytochrome P450 n=1 Tax=Macrophomina phaseolina (strain MS6) TaxID=1126212 RepID=K2S4B2_MACPH|nr:Cytochrome P450 [Macrophomina phaseolina MS6]
MCKNDEWIRLSIGYTMDVFTGAHELRHWPALLRPIVNEVLPSCRNVRAKAAEARSLLEPEIRRRRENNEKLLAEGKPLPKLSDTITWFDEMAKGRPFDPTSMQLSLSAAAMHTTSDLLTNAMYDLCANPEYFEPLREEIMAVLKEDGWKKTSLYKMKLLDSFMKESQRHTPTTIAMMQRKARKAVTLSDGTVIPKGATMAVTTDFQMDPQVYPDPQKFDAYRFLKMRQQPGQENNWQFVSTSPEHMGFGHGIHACPGRFFASNETKILLCYMLIMYDWKFPEGQARPKTWTHTLENTSDPTVKLLFRRREDDVPSWE